MRLAELIDFNPRTVLPKSGAVPFIDMAALPTKGRDIALVGERPASSSGSKFRNGDTLLARITPCLENGKGAKVSGLPQEGVGHGSTEFIVLRAKLKSDENFVYYLSRHPDFRSFAIQQMSGTSGRQRVSWQPLADFEIQNLDVQVRAAIGDTLSFLDDKIELNRRINETLEGMTQAIFRDWFVDFGPVRRALAGATDPVAIMGGLTPDPARAAHLAALFPAAFGNDGLPVGWTFQPVSIFGELKGGKQLEKQHILPAGPNPVFGGAGIMGYATISNADGYVITVGRVGAYCGQFFGYRGAAWVNNNASLIKPLGTTPPEWLLLALRNSDIESIKRGAAQPFVSNGDVGKLPIVDAGANIRTAFQEFVEPMFLLSEAKQVESASLAETRDYLLPQLMSAAVRVFAKAEAG